MTTKVLVSFDDDLLHRIDRAAKAQGLSRSAYLAQLAAGDAAGPGPGMGRGAQLACEELDDLFAAAPPDESTVAIRAARDAR